MSPSVRKQLLEEAIDKIGSAARGWEAMLDVVRDSDPDAVAKALRELGHKLRKKGRQGRPVLRLLCRSDRATDDDRYLLASLELAKSTKDTRPGARATDEALRQLATLLSRGYDLAGALRRDRAVGPRRCTTWFPLRGGPAPARARAPERGREEGGPRKGREDGQKQARPGPAGRLNQT